MSRRYPAIASSAAVSTSLATLAGHLHSQNGEEVALHAQFFSDNRPHTFVELGALDGLTGSNTFALEQALQWRGVLIEANPKQCQKLIKNRPAARCLCTAISANYATVHFESGAYSTTFGERAQMDGAALRWHMHPERYVHAWVPSAPLGHLLRMVGLASIDLVSLDVEGAEMKVLKTYDWSMPVRVWCIEVSSPRHRAVDEFMASKGYRNERWLANGEYELAGSQLWVWNATWTPDEYTWRQYNARSCLGCNDSKTAA